MVPQCPPPGTLPAWREKGGTKMPRGDPLTGCAWKACRPAELELAATGAAGCPRCQLKSKAPFPLQLVGLPLPSQQQSPMQTTVN